MHDPKFEKEVQQKMAELEFSPSESVWANVEKELNQPHTRRSFPFFWRLTLPALLLLAGGGYYFLRSKPVAVAPAHSVAVTATPATTPVAAPSATPAATATTPAATSVTPAPTASPSATSALAPAPTTAASSNSSRPGAGEPTTVAAASDNATTSTHTAHPAAGANTSEGNAISSTLTAAGTGTRPTHSRNPFAAVSNPHRVNRTTKQPAGQSIPPAQSDDFATTSGSGTGRVTTEPVTKSGLVAATTGSATSNNVAATTNNVTTITNNSTATPNNIASSSAIRQPFLFNPVLANLNTAATAVHASKLATKNTIAIKTLQSPHRPWEAAFAGGIGVSSLHQVQISNVTLNNAVSSFSRDSTSNTVTYAAARPSKQYISTVKPGVSFWAGVLAHKPLSDRWGLSIGLNLNYYSTRVRVGEQVDNYTPSSATLLASSAVAPIQSYPYYNAGNEQAYTNRYYFLELPVAAEWRINRSHLLPLFWNGGFSVSYLMGSSAVYYNTKSGVYFKDGGVANHTQVNISTALMVGLPVRGLRVQLGPQVQYGLTPLLNTELSGPQHIFYGGLRLVVYPGKK